MICYGFKWWRNVSGILLDQLYALCYVTPRMLLYLPMEGSAVEIWQPQLHGASVGTAVSCILSITALTKRGHLSQLLKHHVSSQREIQLTYHVCGVERRWILMSYSVAFDVLEKMGACWDVFAAFCSKSSCWVVWTWSFTPLPLTR